jgi:hypothetical protein
MNRIALAVAENLNFDMARLLQVFFDVNGVVSKCGGSNARSRAVDSSAAERTTFIPRPPPAAALIKTGKPISPAILVASASEAMPPSEPGTTGMPSFLAVRLASILSPMRRMCSAFGPMNWTPCSARISANRAFSDRKP